MERAIWEEQHLNEDDLEAYALKRLGPAAAAAVEEHLLFCPDCQAGMVRLDDFLRAFQVAAPRVQSRTTRKERHGGWFFSLRAGFQAPWAAPVLVAAAVAVVVILPRDARLAPVETVRLESARGDSGISTTVAGRRLHLVLDTRGLAEFPVYRVDVVDATGSPVWSGEAKPSAAGLAVTTDRAAAEGMYWVRIHGGGELLREFGVRASPPK